MFAGLLLLLLTLSLSRANPPVTTPVPPSTTTESTTAETSTTTCADETTTTPEPTPAPTCHTPGCIEQIVDDDDGLGACCFGGDSYGQYTEARCPYVFAGVNTTAQACRDRHYCCLADRCTTSNCFECWHAHGKIVDHCDQCEYETTTTTASTTTMTKTATGTTPPAPQPTPAPPAVGCCCTENGAPAQMTAQACYACDGTYQGDGSSCDGAEQGVCRKRCCEGIGSACITCPPNHGNNATLEFIGFGAELCEVDACGVACCIAGSPVAAASVAECEFHGGEAELGVSVEEAQCGVGCCVGLDFSVQDNQEACENITDARFIGENVGYAPGVCGGACCLDAARKRDTEQFCTILSPEECGGEGGVYQGDDQDCGDVGVEVADDDDDQSNSEPSEFGICQNDGCCCLPEGGDSIRVRDSAACYALGGNFQGEGSECGRNTCKGGVCCCEDSFGGIPVNNEAECKLRGGDYQGDGSRIGQLGVCDESGGACYCGDECFEVPTASMCAAGNDFRGVGTKCKRNPPTDDDDDDASNEGPCCLPHATHDDSSLCRIHSHQKCLFLGGKYGGDGEKCGDHTCAKVRGSCCVRKAGVHPTVLGNSAYECTDNLTREECRECLGHWGGPESLCSDEHACAPAHTGTCCRRGEECSVVTSASCIRSGGSFNGYNTTCEEHTCKACVMCLVDGPPCNELLPCANPGAVCSRKYGKCVVLTTPIESEYDYTLPPTSAPETDHVTAPLLPSSTAAPTTVATTADPHGDTLDYIGPLSCGDNSTIGLPCIAKPVRGKCRVGRCVAPPEGSGLSEQCGAVCMNIQEYECGCDCADSWRSRCASLSGRVILDNEADCGVAQMVVELFIRDEHHGYTYVAEHKTDEGGRYVFTGLQPGKYKVRVTLDGCYVHTDGINHRIVELTCLGKENIPLSLSAAPLRLSAQLEHQEKGVHLVEHVNFFVEEDCDAADNLEGDEQNGDIGNAVGDDDDDNRRGRHGRHSRHHLSTGAWVLIALGIAGVALAVYVVMGAGSRSKKRSKKK